MDRREFLTAVGVTGGLALNRWDHALAGDQRTRVPPLPKRPLGRTGVSVTCLGLGGYTGMKEPQSDKFDPVEMANLAIDEGIRYFDTAPAYNNGQSEKNYGEVLAHRRGEVFLAGKTDQRTYDGAMRQVEASLKRLRTDRFDLLQIHSTHVGEDLELWGKPEGVYRALEKLREQKVTTWIGVTGHESAEVMCRVINIYDFDTVLTTFNPTSKRKPYLEKVLPLASRKRMGVIAMKLMGGAFGSLAVGNPIKNDGAANHDDAPQQAGAGTLVRYVLGLPIAVAVVGSGSLEELRVNVRAARQEPLGENERRALEARMNGESARR
jgi:hypothetical protein